MLLQIKCQCNLSRILFAQNMQHVCSSADSWGKKSAKESCRDEILTFVIANMGALLAPCEAPKYLRLIDV
jgi:hypothetical protein